MSLSQSLQGNYFVKHAGSLLLKKSVDVNKLDIFEQAGIDVNKLE